MGFWDAVDGSFVHLFVDSTQSGISCCVEVDFGRGPASTLPRDYGYDYYGTEEMYDGINGEPMQTHIFMGVVHYQRLRHMVADKVHENFFTRSFGTAVWS